MRKLGLAFAFASLFAVAGCGSDGGGATTIDAAVAVTTTQITVNASSFSPATVSIKKGTKVRWSGGAEEHTITSGTGSAAATAGEQFDKNPLAPGEAFEFTFDATGSFPFFCRFHESMGMTGSVTVTD